MVDYTQATLEALHYRTGQLLCIGNRLLAGIFVLGTLFCILSMMVLYLFKHPEQTLHTQAFKFNYTEFSHTAQKAGLTPAATSPNESRMNNTDPNWDGMLAGAGLGLTLGRNVPFIGYIGGPVLGAILGYHLDSRI